MKLSNVLMWTHEYGYRHITVDEASTIYQRTVPARSKIFICGICGQGVTFTAGEVLSRHFRHDSASEKKECRERTLADKNDKSTNRYTDKIKTLPLRLTQQPGRWSIDIGLLTLKKSIIERYIQKTICIKNSDGEVYKYNLLDRLNSDCITWLNAGNNLSEFFELNFDDGDRLPSVWPNVIDGIKDFTFFEVQSGHRLPFFPDVEVGKEYFVFTRGGLPKNFSSSESLEIHTIHLSEHGLIGYNIFRIKALQFNKNTASFFICIKANLKRKSPFIFPLWPEVIKGSHVIYHNANEFFIFIDGDNVKIKIFPNTPLQVLTNKDNKIKLIHFNCTVNSQIVTEDETNLLQLRRNSHLLSYDYFIRQSFEQSVTLPNVIVTNDKGEELANDRVEIISPQMVVNIRGLFDGEVRVTSEDSPLANRYILKGGKLLKIKVRIGQTLTIFQGFDCVRNILFSKLSQELREDNNIKCKENIDWTDRQLYQYISHIHDDEVESSHSLAEFSYFFKGWPAVERWLRQKKIYGTLPKKVKSLLYDLIKNKG